MVDKVGAPYRVLLYQPGIRFILITNSKVLSLQHVCYDIPLDSDILIWFYFLFTDFILYFLLVVVYLAMEDHMTMSHNQMSHEVTS